MASEPPGPDRSVGSSRPPEATGGDGSLSGAAAGGADELSVAVALGANLGDPLATLLAVRPLLAELLQRWWDQAEARLRWSPLFRTAPVGGPAGQPDYLNAVVLLDGGPGQAPADPPGLQRARPAATPLVLLERLQALERRFGRVRGERWGPRSLDLDLLWCGTAALDQPGLQLPHPHLRRRAFVLAPLAAIDPAAAVPGAGGLPAACALELLKALPAATLEPPPQRLPGRAGWPE